MNDGVLSLEASRPADLALVRTPFCALPFVKFVDLSYTCTTGLPRAYVLLRIQDGLSLKY